MDELLIDRYIDAANIKALPPLDLDRPLPYDDIVPAGERDLFLAEHEAFMTVWRPKPSLDAMVQEVRAEFGLTETSEARGHVIG